MANIIRRSPVGVGLRRATEWDPFQIARDLMERFDRDLVPGAGLRQLEEFSPDFELKESKEGYVIRGDVPGVSRDDLDISIDGNVLTVRGRREQEKREEGEQYFLFEREYGSFTRSFSLPEAADAEHCKAELEDGVLTLAMPRREGTKARKIEIASGEEAKH
jgi:HSP20 family protein